MRKLHDAPFPVIDTDPIFGRVIRYMRMSDYALGISLTAVGPAFMYWMGISARFWGTSENAREIKKYREEYRRLKAEGKSMHGTSSLPLSIQRISSEYSTGAFLHFDVAPWFNFVNHPFHGQSDGVIPDDEK
ncbi:hypothetical protein GGH96_001680 [Coemansia sp. RSA 1972]|nr:hypothetical protein GGH96_001680 [Coemansia sp. RSA 1972]